MLFIFSYCFNFTYKQFVSTDVRDVTVLCKSVILSQKVFATSKVAKFCIKYI